jgi:hypothetical protein
MEEEKGLSTAVEREQADLDAFGKLRGDLALISRVLSPHLGCGRAYRCMLIVGHSSYLHSRRETGL